MNSELIAKVVLIGNGRVGKTSIRRRYLGKGFISQHLMTLGADFSEKKGSIVISGSKIYYTLQIWDIAGQDNFLKVRQRFLANTKGVIVVFDVTDEKSFRDISKWILEVWKVNNDITLPLIIIGNKIDLLDQRKIGKEMLISYCKSLKAKYPKIHSVNYIETSALTGKNIIEGFEIIMKSIYSKITKEKDL